MATPKKPSKKPAKPDSPSEPLKLPPSNLRVRINNPSHPHYGKEGWDTGEKATPPGSTVAMHKVVWRKGGDEGCYADPQDLVYPNIPKVKAARQKALTSKSEKPQPKPSKAPRKPVPAAADPVPETGNPMSAVKPGKPPASRKRTPKRPEGKTKVKVLPDGTDPTNAGKHCGARLSRGEGRCRLPAGHGTNHVGEGRCRLHGGATPIKHGRYSSLITRPRLQELMAVLEKDPDPMNLLPELILMRAVVIDFVERYDEMHYGLMLWQYSFEKEFSADWAQWLKDADWHIRIGGKPTDENAPEMPSPLDYVPRKPAQIVDISTASSLATQIGQMVDRMNKMTEDKTFSMTTVARLVEAMSADLTQAALEVITNDESLRDTLLDAVAGRWKLIQLSELAGKRPGSG